MTDKGRDDAVFFILLSILAVGSYFFAEWINSGVI